MESRLEGTLHRERRLECTLLVQDMEERLRRVSTPKRHCPAQRYGLHAALGQTVFRAQHFCESAEVSHLLTPRSSNVMEEAVGVSAGWCNSMYSFLAMCLTGGGICRRRNLQEASSRARGLYTRRLANTSWQYAVLSRTSKQERRPRHINFGEEGFTDATLSVIRKRT